MSMTVKRIPTQPGCVGTAAIEGEYCKVEDYPPAGEGSFLSVWVVPDGIPDGRLADELERKAAELRRGEG